MAITQDQIKNARSGIYESTMKFGLMGKPPKKVKPSDDQPGMLSSIADWAVNYFSKDEVKPTPQASVSIWDNMPPLVNLITENFMSRPISQNNTYNKAVPSDLGAIPMGQDLTPQLMSDPAKPNYAPEAGSLEGRFDGQIGFASTDTSAAVADAIIAAPVAAERSGLMARPTSDAAPTAIESPATPADTTTAIESPATPADTTTTANSFYQDIGEHAETDHGSTPIATADASESHLAAAARSKDVGYGHKIARGGAEDTSGIIHGIQFKNADGTYIPLTNAQKSTILEADMAANLNIARTTDVGGWDTKLAEINTTWDALDSKYQNALTSLAFNVGGTKAADKWTAVLKKAKDKDITGFATDMRRKDNDQYTAGMDNRVAKELYYSGIISNLSEVATQLPLASASTSGIPE